MKLLLIFFIFIVSACGGGSAGESENRSSVPVVNAGSDQTVKTGEQVNLNAVVSAGADDGSLTYRWLLVSIPSGSNISLIDSETPNPSFVPDVDGVYVVQLIVNDGQQDSLADTITITSGEVNSVPIAQAGLDQNIKVGDKISLDGGASTDADGDSLTYQWELVSVPTGSAVTLSNENSVIASFVSGSTGVYVVQLVVNDGEEESLADTVTITVSNVLVNSLPVANAGNDQNVNTGNMVNLDGSASVDADSDLLTYQWSLVSMPVSSTTVLVNPNSVTPSFTPDSDGDYIIQLVVNDGQEDSAAHTITVVSATLNSIPVANAGADQNVSAGMQVILDGSQSTDSDGDLLVYKWSLISTPLGSSAVLLNNASVTPSFTPNLEGAYVAQLIVNDGLKDSPADTVTIVASILNSTPVANAGPDQNINTGITVNLDGSGSMDTDGDLLTYRWLLLSVPVGSAATLSNDNTVSPSFSADIDGSYVVQLIVRDGQVDSLVDTVTITSSTFNSVPVANAGLDQNVNTGVTVNLDGSASTDADADLLLYKWSIISVPTGSAVTLVNETTENPAFTPDVDGAYVIQLIVNDSQDDSQPDIVTVNSNTINSAPVADAGADQNIDTGADGLIVNLDGSASQDVNGDLLTYQWSFVSLPAGSTARLLDESTVAPTFLIDRDGVYVVRLVVNDGQINSAEDRVVITAKSPVTFRLRIPDVNFRETIFPAPPATIKRPFCTVADSGLSSGFRFQTCASPKSNSGEYFTYNANQTITTNTANKKCLTYIPSAIRLVRPPAAGNSQQLQYVSSVSFSTCNGSEEQKWNVLDGDSSNMIKIYRLGANVSNDNAFVSRSHSGGSLNGVSTHSFHFERCNELFCSPVLYPDVNWITN